MSKLLVTLPYCLKDHQQALRLLKWIEELDHRLEHSLLLVADEAIPYETRKALDTFGKSVFSFCETISLKCPAPIADNYHVPAAFMFLKAMGHIDSCYKHNWLWLEPDAVPLKSGWLDMLSLEYDFCPKRFLGSTADVQQEGLPPKVFFATAVYPNCAYGDLKQFCDGKTKAFDMAFSEFVMPRCQNSELFLHRFGAPNDPPTFKEVKMPTDGPNVGALDMIPKEAVLFHRNKDGSLIDLLRNQLSPKFRGALLNPEGQSVSVGLGSEVHTLPIPEKRKPGRPQKQPVMAETP